MLKVSVIIPAYNTADVINRTLESVEKQTYQNYEIVIINDGSTDGTKELLDSYKKGKNNVIVHHQTNQGVSAARNKGIDLATGEFICFLDSDDTYETTFLEEMTRKQEETKGNVICCGFTEIKNKNRFHKSPTKSPDNNKINLSFYFSDGGNCHFSGMLVSKNLLIENNINFDVGAKIGEDILFMTKILYHEEGYFIPKNLFNYFYRENSAMNSSWGDEEWYMDINIRENILDFIEKFYQKDDRENLLNYLKLSIAKRKLNFLRFKLLQGSITFIVQYDKKELEQLLKENINSLRKADKKKVYFLLSKSRIRVILGFIYYKFIKFNKNK